jgi:SnoaL-like domain
MDARDITTITNLLNLYGLAMDTQRWDLFDEIFTPNVDADYGPTSHWRDLATFKRDFAVFHDPLDSTQHAIVNHIIDVRGDVANAFTYGTWRLIRKGVEGGDLWEGTGWYDDELVRARDGWLVRSRTCRIVRWWGNPLVNETIPGVKFELKSLVLRREAEAGRVHFLNARKR